MNFRMDVDDVATFPAGGGTGVLALAPEGASYAVPISMGSTKRLVRYTFS